ncbi:MAG TPA: hypothetical protein VFA59_18125 [Vicinamibacterales bacterium]|nr:hypothetical protein [Vicinamibacterales bacterium]
MRIADCAFTLAAISASACASPTAPSTAQLFQLTITESPSCAGISGFGNFYAFGHQSIHVTGSFSERTFLIVDDALASSASCIGRPKVTLVFEYGVGSTLTGQLGGMWFGPRESCGEGDYLGVSGTGAETFAQLTGTRTGDTATGLLSGALYNGAFFVASLAGRCSASDHSWRLDPAGQ